MLWLLWVLTACAACHKRTESCDPQGSWLMPLCALGLCPSWLAFYPCLYAGAQARLLNQPSPHFFPTSLPLLRRALAVRHGWTAGSGLPDESRAGRLVLRDYTSGKLVYCVLPPSTDGPKSWVPSADDLQDQGPSGRGMEVEDDADEGQGEEAGEAGPGQASEAAAEDTLPTTSADIAAASVGFSRVVAHTKYTLPKFGPPVSDRPAAAPVRGAAASSSGRPGSAAVKAAAPGGVAFDAADLYILQGMDDKPKDKRPDYKFQKKIARSKGDRGQERGEGVFDGGAMVTGKKGGLVRVSGY